MKQEPTAIRLQEKLEKLTIKNPRRKQFKKA